VAYKIPKSGAAVAFSFRIDIDEALDSFFVQIPGGPLDTSDYSIVGSMADANSQVTLNFPEADRSTTAFRVVASAPLTIGDSIDIFVDTNPTSDGGSGCGIISNLIEYVGGSPIFKAPDRKIGFFWEYDFALPAGIQEGDLLVQWRQGDGVAVGDNPPAGWTNIGVNSGGGIGNTNRRCYKIADATDVSTGLMTVTHGGVDGAPIAAVTVAFRNVDQVTPITLIENDAQPFRPILNFDLLPANDADATRYRFDPSGAGVVTTADGASILYMLGQGISAIQTIGALDLPDTPSLPAGASTRGQTIVSRATRTAVAFSENNFCAGGTSQWQGDIDSFNSGGTVVAYMIAQINPA
jgi:hypothetical protein